VPRGGPYFRGPTGISTTSRMDPASIPALSDSDARCRATLKVADRGRSMGRGGRARMMARASVRGWSIARGDRRRASAGPGAETTESDARGSGRNDRASMRDVGPTRAENVVAPASAGRLESLTGSRLSSSFDPPKRLQRGVPPSSGPSPQRACQNAPTDCMRVESVGSIRPSRCPSTATHSTHTKCSRCPSPGTTATTRVCSSRLPAHQRDEQNARRP
jgi:hypothetical protein